MDFVSRVCRHQHCARRASNDMPRTTPRYYDISSRSKAESSFPIYNDKFPVLELLYKSRRTRMHQEVSSDDIYREAVDVRHHSGSRNIGLPQRDAALIFLTRPRQQPNEKSLPRLSRKNIRLDEFGKYGSMGNCGIHCYPLIESRDIFARYCYMMPTERNDDDHSVKRAKKI